MNNKAVYPGTFDPMTLGHEDLVRRAARLFDQVVLAVADSRTKRPLFSLAERIDMARDALSDVKNVTVEGFSGLLMNFVQEHGARVVARRRRMLRTALRPIHAVPLPGVAEPGLPPSAAAPKRSRAPRAADPDTDGASAPER